eukprot:2085228-Pyramimonas_sp.AAC.1
MVPCPGETFNGCSNNGRCNQLVGTCACDAGYEGSSCNGCLGGWAIRSHTVDGQDVMQKDRLSPKGQQEQDVQCKAGECDARPSYSRHDVRSERQRQRHDETAQVWMLVGAMMWMLGAMVWMLGAM